MCHERKQGKKIRKWKETKENETTTGVYFTAKLFFLGKSELYQE